MDYQSIKNDVISLNRNVKIQKRIKYQCHQKNDK